MINQTAASLERALALVLTELQELRMALPMYASWRIGELDTIVGRYCRILDWLGQQRRYTILCSELRRSVPNIQADVAEAVATAHWRPFNRAVMALEFDLEELIRILSGTGPGNGMN